MITLSKLRSRSSSTTLRGDSPASPPQSPIENKKRPHRRATSFMYSSSPKSATSPLFPDGSPKPPGTSRRPASSHAAFPLRSALKHPSSSLSSSHSRPTTPNAATSQFGALNGDGSRPHSPKPNLNRNETSGELTNGHGLLSPPPGTADCVSGHFVSSPASSSPCSPVSQR